LLLQQGVLAKEIEPIVVNIIVVMKINFFMILILNVFNNKKDLKKDRVGKVVIIKLSEGSSRKAKSQNHSPQGSA